MKMRIKNMCLLCVLLLSLAGFNSCETDDYLAAELTGTWRIVEVYPNNGTTPYRNGDILDFNYNGDFYAELLGAAPEMGHWNVDGTTLEIDLPGGAYPDMVAWIKQLDYYYLVLEIDDNYYGISYTLRLVRL